MTFKGYENHISGLELDANVTEALFMKLEQAKDCDLITSDHQTMFQQLLLESHVINH